MRLIGANQILQFGKSILGKGTTLGHEGPQSSAALDPQVGFWPAPPLCARGGETRATDPGALGCHGADLYAPAPARDEGQNVRRLVRHQKKQNEPTTP